MTNDTVEIEAEQATETDEFVTLEEMPEQYRNSHRAARNWGVYPANEEMPEQYRNSHRAAVNWGVYPVNGAERRLVRRDEAEEIISADEDGYNHIVTIRR